MSRKDKDTQSFHWPIFSVREKSEVKKKNKGKNKKVRENVQTFFV